MVSRATRMLLFLALVLLTVPLFAQQTGEIAGTVTASDGQPLPGVTVEARSNVLPQPRVTTTTGTGDYRLPALVPGTYTVTFNLSGLQPATRRVAVQLGQSSHADVALSMAGIAESITVQAEATLIDPTSTAIKSGVSNEQIQELPVGQEYRDLVKLAPGVMYTEDAVRGPSAGGSGQDNVYQFDGVNVTLPLFGTLSAEPSSHDIQQVEVLRGGAKAIDFNRAGGITIDSVSKSGTSEFSGQVSFQIQNDAMSSDQKAGQLSKYDQDRAWAILNLGGPILRDRLFFYGSYYRPTVARANSSNVYGDVPDYDSTRDEGFGKLTYTPTSNLLLNGSYRKSTREETAASIGGTEAPSASVGYQSGLKIATLEGSWIVNNRSFVSGKFTDFANETGGRPDNVLSIVPATGLGTKLDLNNLDQMGYFSVPCPINRPTGAPCSSTAGPVNAFNTFITPFIEKYGYVSNGVRIGGGAVGSGTQFDNDDFFRKSGQLAYDLSLGSNITHDLHAGYQWMEDSEDLYRTSNGWGIITVPGGRVNAPVATTPAGAVGKPVYFQAEFLQQGAGITAPIHSEYVSHNVEINDTIRWGDWTFNAGILTSQDTLYGQDLKNDSSTLSGFVASRGSKYEMYQLDWGKMIQPRLGATWTYNGKDNLFASYAQYKPAASSLPRAASWARNNSNRTVRAYFDETGTLFGTELVASSSGKLFVDDLDPRTVDEYMIGTSQQLASRWTTRAYGRYRYSTNFWEDTNNNARVAFNPPEGVPRDLYIPDLAAKLAQIGSGSTYVIAELDGAFTKYYEATVESDWRGEKTFIRGSYTWSHYYGNFDQDATTTANDANTFIGSSFIADAAGRQIWDNRYGDLHGDRRHMLKVYGSYTLPWRATAGAYTIYQSGQPWEAWSYEPYVLLTSSTSDTSRYAEPAGSRRTPSHYQLDLNYTQNIPIARFNMQIAVDLFNALDKQTGYNPQPSVHSTLFGEPRSFYAPRRFQVAARFQF